MPELSINPAFNPPTSVALDTPTTSTEMFTPQPAYISPHKSGGTHLLTPTPAGQDQHIQHLASPQYQQYAHTYSPSPHSGQLDYQQPLAGPSTYRAGPDGVTSLPPAPNGSTHASSNGQYPAASTQHAVWRVNGGAADARRYQVEEDDGRIGVDAPFGERSYTEMKCLGDGSFGTVWLCDWHSPVKPDVLLSAMQCGQGARPEWAGKRLVALKRMKRVWEGGWSQARLLGELVSLHRIPPHPAIIPLYDAFISPKSRELYFVFECMEGNMYQLTKSRSRRPLAPGLIASCFHQISTGLYHIHQHGYFHRDMKPENLLVTTTGLTDYLTATTLNAINAHRRGVEGENLPRTPNGTEIRYEKDVQVIVKLADFGLARETTSKPPYTEYVSTRWYRAPEVLLRSTEYGPPVDMWALGTILAEMVNLKPLFPGVSEIDQVFRICDTLGDPSSEYGVDERGKTIGGGAWNSGIKLAKNVGFSFPKRKPVHFRGLFNDSVPQSLVDCISDLLLYNPRYRMTSAQCIEHEYFHETQPHLQRTAPLPRIPFSHAQPAPGQAPPPPLPLELTAPPRQVPPSHSHTPQELRPAFANGDMRRLPPPVGTPDHSSRSFFPHSDSWRDDGRSYGPSALVHQLRELDLPTDDLASYGHRPTPAPGASAIQPEPVTAQRSSHAQSTPHDGSLFEGSEPSASTASFTNFNLSISNLQLAEGQPRAGSSKVAAFVRQQQHMQYAYDIPQQSGQPQMPPPIEPTPNAVPLGSLSKVTTGKKKKWGLSSVFGGGDKSVSSLGTVDENPNMASVTSLKRTQSGNNAASRVELTGPAPPNPKQTKKEAEKAARELEKAKREAAARAQRERARAVMHKRELLVEERLMTKTTSDIEYGNNITFQAEAPQPGPYAQPPILSSAMLHQRAAASSRDIRVYPNMPGSQSAQSFASNRSHDTARSGVGGSSAGPKLDAAALAQHEFGPARHKARRRDDDDDHSMSSFDHNSLRSRSALTVGTVDSDPGPRRVARPDWPDPNGPRQHSVDPLTKRSQPNYKPSSSSRLMSGSNPSLESQLANDFMVHANVASSSQTSLGRRHAAAASGLSLHDLPEHPTLAQLQSAGQGSAPTSPYGHPKGTAVAHGAGTGRHGAILPSIRTLSEGQVGPGEEGMFGGQINPMFRVPPASPQDQQTTLPPFSAIASVAGTQRHHQHQQLGQHRQ